MYVVALTTNVGMDPIWYIDIGVTQHMYYDKYSFINDQICDNNQMVLLGDHYYTSNC